MPDPRLLIEAVSAAAESKLGQSIAEDVESLASRAWSHGARAAEDSGSNGSSPALGTLQKIVAGYNEPIPTTLSSAHLLQAGEGQIASALDAGRAAALGVRLREVSAGWQGSNFTLLTPRVSGVQILPAIEVTAESTGGALGSYINGRAKLGAEAFPLSISKSGTLVHEMTHHEQAFLGVCRKSDQFGIGCAEASPEQIEKIVSSLNDQHFIKLQKDIVSSFVRFRKGRQLTAAAAERADMNISSFSSLFGRNQLGSEIDKRLANIEYYQGILEDPSRAVRMKAVLSDLANPETRTKIAGELFPKNVAEAHSEELTGGIVSSGGKWTDVQLVQLKDNFSSRLERLFADNKKLARAWNAAYTNSLHEQEARFNGYVARQAIRSRMDAPSNFWTNQTLNIENVRF